MPTREEPRNLCFVGPMVGRRMGRVTGQGLLLSGVFQEKGYNVVAVSARLNRYIRLFEIVLTLFRFWKKTDALILEVYGGRSFVVEDIASGIARLFRVPIIMWLHGGDMPRFMDEFPRWTRRVLKRASDFVVPSAYLSRALAHVGYQSHIVPNVLDLARYPFRHRDVLRPRMFWMRSFHPLYGPEVAIRVLSRVRKVFPDATLVMGGQDHDNRASVEQQARDLGLDGAVRFCGFLDMSRKIAEAAEADIFLNTNHIDNAPVTLLEACALGLPVVSTSVGGVPDLVTHGETALLVPDDDDESMANEVIRLINDPNCAARLSTNGRRMTELLSVENVFRQWREVITNACLLRYSEHRKVE